MQVKDLVKQLLSFPQDKVIDFIVWDEQDNWEANMVMDEFDSCIDFQLSFKNDKLIVAEREEQKMTRAEAIDLQDAFNHFADGGELYHAMTPTGWYTQSEINIRTNSPTENIICDQHFEARKAHALGQPIELFDRGTWITLKNGRFPPSWDPDWDYRPKQPEPEYEWQWIYKTNDHMRYGITEGYYTTRKKLDKGNMRHTTWAEKFEPSKRIRK